MLGGASVLRLAETMATETAKIGLEGGTKARAEITAEVTEIYRKHNPAKLEDPEFVAKTLVRYKGRENVLIMKLKKLYVKDEAKALALCEE
jgi:hypothetical protein